MPQDPATLFDDDNNIEIASIKSHCSRHGASSEASRPPTSESEGVFDVDEDNEDDDEFPAHISTSLQKSKQRKASQVIISTLLLLFTDWFSLEYQ